MLRKAALALLAFLLSTAACAGVAPFPLPFLNLGSGGGGVLAIAPLPDGSVLIGGNFSTVNGIRRSGIARLAADGSLDQSWGASLRQGAEVNAIAVNGSDVYVGGFGTFTSQDGVFRTGAARLSLLDGSVDAAWNAQVSNRVNALAIAGTDLVIGGGSRKSAARRAAGLRRCRSQPARSRAG
jgi:hypothetical protein